MGRLKNAIKRLGFKFNGKKPKGEAISDVIEDIVKDFDNGNIVTKDMIHYRHRVHLTAFSMDDQLNFDIYLEFFSKVKEFKTFTEVIQSLENRSAISSKENYCISVGGITKSDEGFSFVIGGLDVEDFVPDAQMQDFKIFVISANGLESYVLTYNSQIDTFEDNLY